MTTNRPQSPALVPGVLYCSTPDRADALSAHLDRTVSAWSSSNPSRVVPRDQTLDVDMSRTAIGDLGDTNVRTVGVESVADALDLVCSLLDSVDESMIDGAQFVFLEFGLPSSEIPKLPSPLENMLPPLTYTIRNDELRVRTNPKRFAVYLPPPGDLTLDGAPKAIRYPVPIVIPMYDPLRPQFWLVAYGILGVWERFMERIEKTCRKGLSSPVTAMGTDLVESPDPTLNERNFSNLVIRPDHPLAPHW